MSTPEFPADSYAIVEGWSALEAAGPDAGKFLQAFCTNDVLKLAAGESCEAMFTDVKAHVLAYTWVGCVADDRYLALLTSPRAESLLAHLDRYLIREKVELSILPTSNWTLCATAVSQPAVPLAAFGSLVASHAGKAPGGQRLDTEAFEQLRIRLGVPLDGIDVDERNLPQEVDRNEQAISFTKGCYLGQEPVARIDALGRVNWQLRGLLIEGAAPKAGDELTAEDKVVGRVTSAVATERGSIAMAYVHRKKSEPGTQLTLNGSLAVVHSFPIPTAE